jgi:cellulose synthase/poly-beta-1,6-N-acetylglucosamine synthase-like glycosyltransferase
MLLSVLTWLIALPLMVMLGIFTLELYAGLWPAKRRDVAFDPAIAHAPKIAILMPAHNEARTIQAMLGPLLPLLNDNLKLVVIADNCSDDTASVAAMPGIQVIERHDPENRGKGYALAFGQEFLKKAPPEVFPECVIIMDADCTMDAASMGEIARSALHHGVPVQARYVFHPDPSASPKVQISNFAFWVKNVIRQRGGRRLGGAAILGGTGMAFPWPLFAQLPLASGDIVEDLGLCIAATKRGHAPLYLDHAHVYSAAADEGATLGQRTRWEHGFLMTARTHALGSICDGIGSGNRKLFQLGLHLLVPPLALLFILSFAVLLLLAVIAFSGGAAAAFVWLLVLLFCAAIGVLLAWASGGHHWLSIGALLRLPLYVLWKIPIYLRLAKGEKSGWTRTDRTDGGNGPEAL